MKDENELKVVGQIVCLKKNQDLILLFFPFVIAFITQIFNQIPIPFNIIF